MNSKERVLRTLNRQETDRVPFDLFGTSDMTLERIRAHMKLPTVDSLLRELGIDIWCNWYTGDYTGEKRKYKGLDCDFWGVPLTAQSHGDSSLLAPLMEVSSVEEVENYKWPDPNDFDMTNVVKRIETHTDFAVSGGVWAPIFHNITWLCGFETTLINLQAESEITEALIRHVTDFWVVYTKRLLEAANGKIDIIQNCNDFGAQSSITFLKKVCFFCKLF
jgi:uroporphyrinogen decarboxylase